MNYSVELFWRRAASRARCFSSRFLSTIGEASSNPLFKVFHEPYLHVQHHSYRRSFSKNVDHGKGLLLRSSQGSQNEDRSRKFDAKKIGKKKELTLDQFVENIGKSKTKERKGDSRNLSRNIQSSSDKSADHDSWVTQYAKRKPTPSSGRADMTSFFDQVDALVEKSNSRDKNAAGDKFGVSSSSMDSPSDTRLAGSSMSPGQQSIFDIIPTAFEDSGSLYYDRNAFEQYLDMLETIAESPKFLRKHTSSPLQDDLAIPVIEWLKAKEPTVDTNLPKLAEALKGRNRDDEITSNSKGDSYDTHAGSATQFRHELTKQREKFMAHHGWTKLQHFVAVKALINLGSHCAKNSTAPPLEVAWEKLKEAGYMMDKNTLHNYLYVSSTFSSLSARRLSSSLYSKSSGGTVLDFLDGLSTIKSEASDMENENGSERNDYEKGEAIDVSAEVALCHNFLFEPTEQSTSIHVRVLVSQGKANQAERVLDATMRNDDLRLRTYAPVYDAYLDQRDVTSAFKLFVKMKQGNCVQLQPETYVQLIACIAESGYFRTESDPIEGIKVMGYSEDCGPALFDTLASELAESSMEISSASAKRLYNSFQRGFLCEDKRFNLKPMHMFESFKTNNDPAKPDELIVSRVLIDEGTGRCSRSGSKLRLIGLDSNQKQHFRDGLIQLCSSAYEERRGKKAGASVADELKNFGKWLENRDREPFTAILDGPNIGYYMQNFDQGRFNYHQIKLVVDALEEMGENALVVLPQQYVQDTFRLHAVKERVRQILTEKEKDIRDDLVARGKIYVVPVGSLDDYYWMYASVSMKEHYLSPENDARRWPGTRPMLVSNDKLRDHRMALLEPRLFRRWYSSFLVNFAFSAFVGDECIDKDIGFRTADFYSREIQGNPSMGENEEIVGTVWHFPVSDWDENECLCIRMPTR